MKSYFLFERSRIQNLRKNGPIWQKIQKKVNSAEFMEFVFSRSAPVRGVAAECGTGHCQAWVAVGSLKNWTLQCLGGSGVAAELDIAKLGCQKDG